ncbi:MAG: radical SAM protein, partial [Ileibacterium sp.]|nr:radical SAM protein [Ileibacterium sp.]
MTFDIITLGCKVNEYESQFYKEQMEKLHLQPKTDHTPADVVIINTCTVTNTAASKSRQKIRKARKENPDAILAVVGCYAQTMEEEIRRDLQADLLIGAAHKNEIALQVAKLLEKKKADVALERIENIVDFESMPIGAFEGQHRAFLKIQDGCNQYCAYCQIPLARGPERSQMPSQVVEIAKSLADKGHLEIVLTGIHTGRYSFRKENLAQLLKELLEATNENVCFRISSIEITEVSDELLDLMASNPRILPHLHIPIQSGCN